MLVGARERAKQLVDGHAVELWQGDRKIDRFDHPPIEETTWEL